MYEVSRTADGLKVLTEKLGRPIVYLDHWAFNEIALASAVREKFVKAMVRLKGTLRVSVYNVVELIHQTDPSQRESIVSLLDEVDSGFIHINPQEVIQREDERLHGAGTFLNPSSELSVLNVYYVAMNHPEIIRPSDVVNTVLSVADANDFRANDESYSAELASMLVAARASETQIAKHKARFQMLRSRAPAHETATRELVEMALCFLITNRTMKMSQFSEWRDLFHVVVPVAYCDIALIDRRWINFIKQTGMRPPAIAYTFDKRELANFFDVLEKWPGLAARGCPIPS